MRRASVKPQPRWRCIGTLAILGLLALASCAPSSQAFIHPPKPGPASADLPHSKKVLPPTTTTEGRQSGQQITLAYEGGGIGIVAVSTVPLSDSPPQLFKTEDFVHFTNITPPDLAADPDDPEISDVFFLNPDDGWVSTFAPAAAQVNNYETRDGGRSWQKVGGTTHTMDVGGITYLQFLSPSVGYMDTLQPTGPAADLMTTSDGGLQWTPVASTNVTPNGLPLAQTHFFDPSDAVAVTGSLECLESTIGVEFSSDGGRTWAAASLPASFVAKTTTSICPSVPVSGGSGEVMAVASVGQYSTHLGFLTSVDTGKSWQLAAMAPAAYSGSGVEGTLTFDPSPPGVFGAVAEDGTWWVAGPLSSGSAVSVSVSTDDGTQWSTSVVHDLPTHLLALVPIDSTHAWIVGENGANSVLYQTADGGSTWSILGLGP